MMGFSVSTRRFVIASLILAAFVVGHRDFEWTEAKTPTPPSNEPAGAPAAATTPPLSRSPPRQAGIRHEIFMCAESAMSPEPHELSIGAKAPGLRLVLQVMGHDFVQDLTMNRRILDRDQGFNTPVQIAGHPVRRGYEDFCLGRRQIFSIREANDPAMLEKASDNAFDPDVLG